MGTSGYGFNARQHPRNAREHSPVDARLVGPLYYGCVSLLIAAIAVCVFNLPLQVSDNLDKVLAAVEQPVTATLRDYSKADTLRPVSGAFAHLLSRPWIDQPGRVARGINALQAAISLILFSLLFKPRDTMDALLALLAVLLLAGHLAFWQTFLEGYPVNHFGLVLLCFLGVLHVVRRDARGSVAFLIVVFLAATALFAVELGVAVVAIVGAAVVARRSGVAKAQLAGVAVVAGVYVILRWWLLDVPAPGLGGQRSGFGFDDLDSDEIRARFGSTPVLWFAHNVAVTVSSIIFPDPFNGNWEMAQRIFAGTLRPVDVARIIVAIGMASVVAIAAVKMYRARRRADNADDVLAIAALIVTVAVCALLNYRYVKTVLIVPAVVCYGWVFYHCARSVFTSTPPAITLLGVTVLSVAAALPVADLPCEMWAHGLRNSHDWAYVPVEAKYDASTNAERALVERLRVEALAPVIPTEALATSDLCWSRRPVW
jgi:hypothetical protein